MEKRDIGIAGENAACAYLSKKGEIDIIAMDRDGCRVFVEVKTRKNRNYGNASEFVDYRKQEKIRRTALAYCGGECYMRFDIIEVYYHLVGDSMKIDEINHIEEAF